MNDITEMLESIIDKKYILKNEPMSKHTSFKIGGNADYYIKIQTEKDLVNVLKLIKENDLQYTIVGNGTNLLVKDGGIRGLVLKLELKDYYVGKQEEFAYITASAGLPLIQLALIAMENGLTGFETLSGIPGTVGGAIRMNAGAYGKEIKDLVVYSKCIDKNGNIVELNLADHKFSYRKSAFEDNELIILETTFKLEYDKKENIKKKMDECKVSRIQNQPLEFPNAGSIFKRMPDVPVAKLIDECGLKGFNIGDAEVSKKHAGFIINKGKATSKDVLDVVNYVTKEVKTKFNKEVKLEVIVIGED